MNENEQAGGNMSRLFAAIAAVKGDVRRLEKTGYNSHFKYDFVTAEDVKDLVRPLLARHKLAVVPAILNVERVEVGKQALTRLEMAFVIGCGETGESITLHWYSEALDNQDKGINKALTAATKNFLLNTFEISTGDEVDIEQDEPQPPAANGNGNGHQKDYSFVTEFFERAFSFGYADKNEVVEALRVFEVYGIPTDPQKRKRALSNLADYYPTFREAAAQPQGV